MEHVIAFVRLTRKNNSFLVSIFLIGGLVTTQLGMSVSSAQATSSTTSGPGWSDTLEYDCGVFGPYTKGYTKWWGWYPETSGIADSTFFKWNTLFGKWEQKSFDPGERKYGVNNTATANSGTSPDNGAYYGITRHNTSFYQFVHRKDSQSFTCPR